MTDLVRFPSFPRAPAAAGRLRFALAASVLAHWALLATPIIETRRSGAVPPVVDVPMTVSFAPLPGAVRDAPAVMETEISRVPGRTWPATGDSVRGGNGLPAAVAAPSGAEVPVALRASDPTYYPAGELDAYPQPAQPLELDRLQGAGSIRLLLLIDEHGIVNDLSLVEAGGSARLDEALLAVLVAARFIPARKDGRDVKSRVLLRVGPGPRSGNQ